MTSEENDSELLIKRAESAIARQLVLIERLETEGLNTDEAKAQLLDFEAIAADLKQRYSKE